MRPCKNSSAWRGAIGHGSTPSAWPHALLLARAGDRAHRQGTVHKHDAPKPLRGFTSGQKREAFGVIKRELRRRSAIEPVIGSIKSDGATAAITSGAARVATPTPYSAPSTTISAAQLAEASFVSGPHRDPRCRHAAISSQAGFLMDNSLKP